MFEFQSLGTLIRLRRQERNLSLERLSKLAKVSRRQLSMIEEGRNFSLSYLVKVANALELTELPLDGLQLRPGPPELDAVVRAADAVAAAERSLAQAAEITEQLRAASQVLDAMVRRLLKPAPPAAADLRAKVEDTLRRLESVPEAEREQVGGMLRELADGDRPRRTKPLAAATPAARKRAR
jgi:transcriptional regulator with XRE-family HTH domain